MKQPVKKVVLILSNVVLVELECSIFVLGNAGLGSWDINNPNIIMFIRPNMIRDFWHMTFWRLRRFSCSFSLVSNGLGASCRCRQKNDVDAKNPIAVVVSEKISGCFSLLVWYITMPLHRPFVNAVVKMYFLGTSLVFVITDSWAILNMTPEMIEKGSIT